MFHKDLTSAAAALALAALLVPSTLTAQDTGPAAQPPNQSAPRTVELDQRAGEQQPAEAAPAFVVDPVIAAVRERLAPAARGADREDRQALVAFYGGRTEPPVWVTANGFSPAAKAVMAEIRKADDWGLSAAAFDLPRDLPAGATPAQQAEAEVKLGLAILKYARHARGGRVEPAQISRNIDQKAPLRDPKTVIKDVAEATAPDAYLRSLHPKHVQFDRLRHALLKLRASPHQPEQQPSTPEEVSFPEGPSIRLGMQHPHVALLRKRLGVASRPGQEMVFDPGLEQALRAFQEQRGIVGSGILTPRTRVALNASAPKRAARSAGTTPDVQRILINMERWRWMPEDLGEFYVWDNVPEYITRVVKNGKEIHSAKIVVGKLETQTPVFSANMKYIVFHPEWGVPDSIKTNELLPYLRPNYSGFWGGWGGADTRILAKHNLRVSYGGRPVDPSTIDWQRVDIRKFTFIQPAGASNVLGEVKFRFPNKHDVYMHDTPQKDLFEKTTRTFSHGCMRVQNPRRLAEILLAEDKGWSPGHVASLFAGGYNNEVTLNKQIPVHVTYFTMLMGDDGTMRNFADVYSMDSRISAALAGRPLPPLEFNDSVAEGPQREARRGKQPLPPMRQNKGTNFDAFSNIFNSW